MLLLTATEPCTVGQYWRGEVCMPEEFDDLRNGYRAQADKIAILREALSSVGVELGEYEEGVIAGWDWPTLAVVASLVTRVAAATAGRPGGRPGGR
jgi:hypothetical protein